MGAGASTTGMATSLDNATQEELDLALSGLTPEGRERLAASLAPMVSKDKGGNAADNAAEGGNASEEAPYLKEFFAIQAKAVSEAIEMASTLLFEENPEEKLKAKQAETVALLKVPLEKSFKRHDVKGNGILDKEEAAAFFKHFVGENANFAKATTASLTRQSVMMSISMGAGMLGAEAESAEDKAAFEEFMKILKAQAEESVKAMVKLVTERMETQMADYAANKDERNAAAFKVLDTNEDGTLQLAEVEAVFLAEKEGEKSVAFTAALGFAPPPPEELQKAFNDATKQGGEEGAANSDGCPVQ